ncbi:myosin-11 isoform X2 [Telopea speciosissima]|uniref:myosin-11 isoform X2 n=1 Tax=Telopea speciosissima TaxID=54955 RepID=UPI001CC55687|nr:myosin-11 isoform X2 [Telopea speciosissima]
MTPEEKTGTPVVPRSIPSPNDEVKAISSHQGNDETSSAKNTVSPKDFIISVARKFSVQSLQNPDPGVWGVLTAISNNARKRPQGINILLTADEHCIGRLVEDKRFQIESNAVSGNHCRIYRKRIVTEDVEQPSSLCTSVFLKDSSTNGTFVNWERLKKNSTEVRLQHGDIISFAAPPQHDLSFAFVYRECLNSAPMIDDAILKRKAEEEFGCESKRLKGIGIGAPEGPISLDDVRSLQRSNMELRKQLESHVLTVETMRKENRAVLTQHENEMKELKESVSQSFLDQIKELRNMLEVKQKELAEGNSQLAEKQHAMEDLNERLNASMQSRRDADEIINSQKASISELEARVDDERNQRREEREKAEVDLKVALQKVHSEAQEELKRQSKVASIQQKELQEVINKLQESDKEKSLLVESSRAKLEDFRESLVISEKKVRQLEGQIKEEQKASADSRKKVEKLEHEMKRLRKELESEKVAREEAWAKVSALELEMASALHDLSIEKQRFQGAKERIILRETQLRAFYSTTEEISALFGKQQEQLKAMQRTLEDEENYENAYIDTELNASKGTIDGVVVRENAATSHRKNTDEKEGSTASTRRVVRVQIESTSDEVSATEKHDCEIRSQENQHTQDAECTSADRSVKGGFGSEIDGVGTAPVLEGDPIETERVLGTESPAVEVNFGERNLDLNKCNTLAGDTMQIDNEPQLQETREQFQETCENTQCLPSNDPNEVLKTMEDTEVDNTIRTADLLASEVAGSWAVSTAPSVHGENESPSNSGQSDSVRSNEECVAAQHCSDAQAAGSQILPCSAASATKLSQERQALNEMIKIVAPDYKHLFGSDNGGGSDQGVEDEASTSGSDTEEGSNHDCKADVGSISDSDTKEGSDQGGGGNEVNSMDEGNNATQEDSLG